MLAIFPVQNMIPFEFEDRPVNITWYLSLLVIYGNTYINEMFVKFGVLAADKGTCIDRFYIETHKIV